MEFDFSGSEVIASHCLHKDKNFYKYLTDPDSDMHMDVALDLFMLPRDMMVNTNSPEERAKAKMIRFFAKNNWTFAQFYGDWFASCAPNLWENVIESELELPTGQTVKSWLKEKGIYDLGEMAKDGPTPGSFMEHCAKVENKMWNERVPEYTQWKKDIVENYINYGFIENPMGFRFSGYMGKHQCCNYPIQSLAFQFLLWSLIRVQRTIKKRKLDVKLCGQIHDSGLSIVHKSCVYQYAKEVTKIVTSLYSEFSWMEIPMEIEIEISEVGGNFAEMTEYSLEELKEKFS
jgi:hypothetical protein